MATTAVQSRTSNIAVPSIHLGTFSPYPKMPSDFKQPTRFPEENTVPVFRDRDEKPATYQSRNSSQWRPNQVSYPPNQSHSYNNRSSYVPPTAMSRTPPRSPTPSGLYSNVLQAPNGALPVQAPNSPAQLPSAPREVCVECMMRDKDMADVDVTSPGIWERESDVYYRELCAREEEEEREREANGSPPAHSSSTAELRPRAKGSPLTEGNLKVWLTLNPREAVAKQQTLHLYLDTQHALLAAEEKARLKAMKESRQLQSKMRDTYSQLRRSAYDLGTLASAVDDTGVKIRSPSMDDMKHRRDTTLLENGMIVERLDIRKEEARLRKEERRAHKASRDSLNVVDNRERERDAVSMYSFQAAEGAASLRIPAPQESAISMPLPSARSVRSMYTTPSSSWQPQLPARPMSIAPALPGSRSQTSLVSGSHRRRFLGLRYLSDYFGSNTTLAPSGSMMDMHLGLDQEKHLAQTLQVDLGSGAPSIRERPNMEMRRTPDLTVSDRASSEKKKRRGFSRLWKKFTGGGSTPDEPPPPGHGTSKEAEDEYLPLAPPPSISYLVNRSNGQSDRSKPIGQHASMPSLTSQVPQHPRSISAPNGIGLTVGSASEKTIPPPLPLSPIELRLPHRDSSGDEPEEEDNYSVKKAGESPKRAIISNVSEPDVRRSSPPQAQAVPIPRNSSPSSSSLTPTIKVPPVRPASVMSLEKSLPPLPLGEYELMPDRLLNPALATSTFPSTAYNPSALPNGGIRTQYADHRMSVGGTDSRLALPRGARATMGPSAMFDDFGTNPHGLNGFQPLQNTKRRSRFGLGALLGKKGRHSGEKLRRDGPEVQRDTRFDPFVAHGIAPSMSDRSTINGTNASSSPARRPLDELVLRDPDFVAYRYPSRDQRLDLSCG